MSIADYIFLSIFVLSHGLALFLCGYRWGYKDGNDKAKRGAE